MQPDNLPHPNVESSNMMKYGKDLGKDLSLSKDNTEEVDMDDMKMKNSEDQ